MRRCLPFILIFSRSNTTVCVTRALLERSRTRKPLPYLSSQNRRSLMLLPYVRSICSRRSALRRLGRWSCFRAYSRPVLRPAHRCSLSSDPSRILFRIVSYERVSVRYDRRELSLRKSEAAAIMQAWRQVCV